MSYKNLKLYARCHIEQTESLWKEALRFYDGDSCDYLTHKYYERKTNESIDLMRIIDSEIKKREQEWI